MPPPNPKTRSEKENKFIKIHRRLSFRRAIVTSLLRDGAVVLGTDGSVVLLEKWGNSNDTTQNAPRCKQVCSLKDEEANDR